VVTRVRASLALGALAGIAALWARPLGAQLVVRGASACFAPRPAAGAALAPGGADSASRTRSRDLETRHARSDLASGRTLAAADRLEPAAGAPVAGAGDDGALLSTLALAYWRLGCRQAFAGIAERALRAAAPAAPAADAARLSALLPLARAPDSVPAAGLAASEGDTTREGALARRAWWQYAAGRFEEAAASFARVVDAAPAVAARAAARAMRAQSLLEAGRSLEAADEFLLVKADARRLLVALEARVSAPGWFDTVARTLAEHRASSLLWAGDVREGRLVVPVSDTGAPAPGAGGAGVAGGDSGEMRAPAPLRALHAADITRWLEAVGGAAADPVARELVWTSDDVHRAALRAAVDSLELSDVRVSRAAWRSDAIRAERAGRIADAVRFKGAVAALRDSLAVSDGQLAALEDSLVKRDAAIALNIAEYRAVLEAKIAGVRDLAGENVARIDSSAGALRALGAVPASLVAYERAAAEAYVTTAEQAAGALDVGLTRLPVLLQRDTLRLRVAAFVRTLAEVHAAYDSALAKAQVAEAVVTAAEDRRIADATAELDAAAAARDTVLALVARVTGSALRARADSLRGALDRAIEAADFGVAAATFFVALAGDTAALRPPPFGLVRPPAIDALTGAIAAHPASPLRARALMELGELLTRRADAEYAAAQRANANVDHPDYAAAMARFDELLRDFPDDPEADAAAYTLGTLAFFSQRYDDALRALERVTAQERSHFRPEAFFRHGDARFELAAKQAGDARRALFAQAGQSYERAIALSSADGDIYYLALYKLGWSWYVQADRQSSDEYRKAVDVFARLVREVDRLPKERQARLALRQEAIDYLAIAITQLGGAEDAVRYLAAIPDEETRILVLRRVARALRDQGEFTNAAIAYRAAIDQAPTDALTLDARRDLVDLFQSRMLEPARAQQARLELADASGPDSPWGLANPARAADAAVARERALREGGAYALAEAKKAANRAQAPQRFAEAAELLGRYLREFTRADSAQRVSALEAEALFSAGEWLRAGAAFNRTALQWRSDSALGALARRNAIVAFDSALAAERRAAPPAGPAAIAGPAAPSRTAQLRSVLDSLFAATDRFVVLAPDADARSATVAKGRRAAEGERWEVVATTFEVFASRWPADPFAAEARKLVGDARYREGRYFDAQREWRAAQTLAEQGSRKAFADSIARTRLAAAGQAADSLVRSGRYAEAADSIFTAIAADVGDPARAADALRNAIEVHLAGDSVRRAAGDTAGSRDARTRAVAAIERLAATYPAYRHTLAYSALHARLLSDLGRAGESADALTALIAAQPAWSGRADAMVRVAALLDSLGRRADAAQAWERFSTTYPADRRAADAQYNAAVTFAEATDAAGAAAAARSYAAFVQRFPRDARVGAAQRARVEQLRAAGEEGAATAELTRLCVRPVAAMAAPCAERAGAQAFRDGLALWDRYAALRLEIASRAQLTRAGVEQASAAKERLLRTMSAHFSRAIASGASEWIAAGSFQSGLAQWHYGLFLRDVVLPADLTESQRDAVTKSSAQQAQSYFDAAVTIWQALVEKGAAEKFENAWMERARAALRGEGIPAREIIP